MPSARQLNFQGIVIATGLATPLSLTIMTCNPKRVSNIAQLLILPFGFTDFWPAGTVEAISRKFSGII